MFSKGVTAQKKFSDFLEDFKKIDYPAIRTPVSFSIIPGPSPIKFSVIHPVIRPDFYLSCLGFFCKNEIKLDKLTPLPFRFRLGSLEYVNEVEYGNRNSNRR
jgi:hypothetical protein